MFIDPPDHTRIRGLISKVFTPRMLERRRAHIQQIVDDLIDAAALQDDVDWIRDIAYPLPVTVIAELLGVDADHHHAFKRWSDAIIQGGTGSAMGEMEGVPFEAMKELRHYLRPIVRARRKQPDDGLISILGAAEGAEGRGGRWTATIMSAGSGTACSDAFPRRPASPMTQRRKNAPARPRQPSRPGSHTTSRPRRTRMATWS